jgi:hypothetical protein
VAPRFTKSWEQVRRENPVDERLVAAYTNVLAAEERIAQARVRRGETWETIDAALAASEPFTGDDDNEEEGELYLTILARFIAGLGGHLEVVAVFADEAIVLRREPEARRPRAGRRARAGRECRWSPMTIRLVRACATSCRRSAAGSWAPVTCSSGSRSASPRCSRR